MEKFPGGMVLIPMLAMTLVNMLFLQEVEIGGVYGVAEDGAFEKRKKLIQILFVVPTLYNCWISKAQC